MRSTRAILCVHGATGAILLWAYWPTLLEAAARWREDPQYSHGFLVPIFSAYLLWRNREQLIAAADHPRWWGVALFLTGAAVRLAGYGLYLPWLDMTSLLICLAGWAATAGGRPALRAALPAILFLGFILPLPYRIQNAMSGSLQRTATLASTYLLQTLGVPAVAEGNTIVLSEVRMGIVEACNGLSMLVTFFALATGFAILVRRPWWDRLILVASAAPIAVAANVVRITVTGALYEASRNELAQVVFHDVAGWLMMPLALLMLFAELAILRRVIIAKPGPGAAYGRPVG
jgi:exosortase